MTARCRSCGAEIVWARTERGGRMPLERAEAGDTVVFLLRDAGSPEGPLAVSAGPRWAGELYRSHFATCPEADEWRQR